MRSLRLRILSALAGLSAAATFSSVVAVPHAHASAKPASGAAANNEAAVAAEAPVASRNYIARWLPMPPFTAETLGSERGTVSIEPKPGRMTVVLFLASWCEPCQRLMADYLWLQKRYQRLNTDFYFVFAHDTRADAEGFMKEFGLTSAYLGTFDALKAYKNPELPTVYIGDRRGWMSKRLVNTKPEDLAQLDSYLKLMTSF